MVGYHIDSLWKSPNDSRTARCVPPRMWSRAWDIQVFCLSLWRTVIASSIPILSLPDISFPPIYWGGGRRQNRNTHLWPCWSCPILFIFCLFCFFFLNQTEVLPPTVCLYSRDHHQTCSFQMPQPPCLFQGHFAIFFSSHDCAVSITLISPLDNSSLNISTRLFLREQ